MEKQLSFLDIDIENSLKNTYIANMVSSRDGNDDNFYYDCVDPFRDAFEKTSSNDLYEIGYATGLTKGVLIFTSKIEELESFVLKFPFRYQESESEYDAEADEYIDCSPWEMENSGADNGEGWNYCQAELEEYERAKAQGVENFFVRTEFYNNINGCPIYKQEYAVVYHSAEDSTHTHTEEDEERVSDLCSESGCEEFNTGWLSDAFVYFGEDSFYKFLTFVDYEGIQDLHANNIGYSGMRPVLIDFSSYND